MIFARVHYSYDRHQDINFNTFGVLGWLSSPFVLHKADDTASSPATSITGFERFLVVASSQVIGTCMNNNSTSNNTKRAIQGDQFVLERERCRAVFITLDVPQVADMSLGIRRGTVVVAVRVEVAAGRQAAVRQISCLVDMEPTLGRRIQVLDISCHGDRAAFGGLLEGHCTRHRRVTFQHNNSFVNGRI